MKATRQEMIQGTLFEMPTPRESLHEHECAGCGKPFSCRCSDASMTLDEALAAKAPTRCPECVQPDLLGGLFARAN